MILRTSDLIGVFEKISFAKLGKLNAAAVLAKTTPIWTDLVISEEEAALFAKATELESKLVPSHSFTVSHCMDDFHRVSPQLREIFGETPIVFQIEHEMFLALLSLPVQEFSILNSVKLDLADYCFEP